METCNDCSLTLPSSVMYSCDHCPHLRRCMSCVIKHGKMLTMEYRQIPELMRTQ
jgi:hypothetical protein